MVPPPTLASVELGDLTGSHGMGKTSSDRRDNAILGEQAMRNE